MEPAVATSSAGDVGSSAASDVGSSAAGDVGSSAAGDVGVLPHKGWIYIAASRNEFRKMISRVGKTVDLDKRWLEFNVGVPKGSEDQVEYLAFYKVPHIDSFLNIVMLFLKNWRVEIPNESKNGGKNKRRNKAVKYDPELVHMPFKSLKKIVDLALADDLVKNITEFYIANNAK